MQFSYEAVGANNTTRAVFPIAAGKAPVVTVIRGRINQISIAVTVTHTDVFGPDPPAELVNHPVLKLEKGWPFRTTYDFDWDLEVDGDEISILGDSKETPRVKRSKEGVTTLLKAKGGPKFLEIHAVSKFSQSGLKLDLPFVEGEGDIINVGGRSVTGTPVKFLCKLEAERAENKSFPKIPDGLVSAKAYFDAKNEGTLPTQSVKDVEAWVRGIKDFADGALYRAIRDGQVTLHLDGHTSRSGSKDYNKKLAESRIRAVATILKKSTNFGSGIDIVPAPKKQSGYEEKHDYRVELYFDKVKAEIAMKAGAS